MPEPHTRGSRRRLVLRAALLLALVSGGVGLALSITKGRLHNSASGYAVIYARQRYVSATNSDETDILWQRLPTGAPRVVFTIPQHNWIPQDAGFLPSPDGRWLYVWYECKDEYGLPTTSRFLVLRLPDGEVTPIAEVKAHAVGDDIYAMKLVPYWLDRHRVVLEGNAGSTVFDAKLGRLTAPLPTWPPKAPPQHSPLDHQALERPEGYIRRHYAKDLDRFVSTLTNIGDQLRLTEYLEGDEYPGHDSPEALLLRGLGVTDVSGYRGSKRAWPSVSPSPNGRFIARAGVFLGDRIDREDCSGQWSHCREVEARLDIFDVSSGEQVRSAEFLWAGAYREDGRPFRAGTIPEWLAPRFANPRWSADGRLFCYGIHEFSMPPGLPSSRRIEGAIQVQGRSGRGFSHDAVVVTDAADMADDPRERLGWPWSYLYIPDAFDAFVIPAAGE